MALKLSDYQFFKNNFTEYCGMSIASDLAQKYNDERTLLRKITNIGMMHFYG